jgi:hypothetical protein
MLVISGLYVAKIKESITRIAGETWASTERGSVRQKRNVLTSAGSKRYINLCAKRNVMSKESERHEPYFAFSDVVELAKEVLVRDGQHIPTLMIQGSTAQMILQLSDLPSTPEEKHQVMFLCGVYVAQEFDLGSIKAIYFVSEGWLSRVPTDRAEDWRPSQSPQRRETLLIAALYPPTGRQELALQEIIRHGASETVDLVAIQPTQAHARPDSPLVRAFAEGHKIGKSASLR